MGISVKDIREKFNRVAEAQDKNVRFNRLLAVVGDIVLYLEENQTISKVDLKSALRSELMSPKSVFAEKP